MSNNNIFPELEGWEEILTKSMTKEVSAPIKTTHKLVIALVNLRSAVSSQLVYLQNKIEGLQNNVNQLNQSFIRLNENISKADESSTNLAKALNRLTLWGVIVVGTGIFLALIQFLFQNKLWPFSQ